MGVNDEVNDNSRRAIFPPCHITKIGEMKLCKRGKVLLLWIRRCMNHSVMLAHERSFRCAASQGHAKSLGGPNLAYQ